MEPATAESPTTRERLVEARGRATEFRCSAPWCGWGADEWAWDRSGPSADLSAYVPVCRSHGARLISGGSFTHCGRGHEYPVIGGCPTCRTDRARERQRAHRADPERGARRNAQLRERRATDPEFTQRARAAEERYQAKPEVRARRNARRRERRRSGRMDGSTSA